MPQPSLRPGLGAIPYPGGVTFRVWAPFAPDVFVAGDFNNWDQAATPLASEGNGNWSLDVPGAAIGQKYKFKVGGQLRIDPRAARVTNSIGDGIIESPDFPWVVNDFRIPPWNELVVYEMHIGTFPDQPTIPGQMIDAVIQDLWYLQELGINAIEVMPTGEFPQDRSWGYNPAHIFAVESAYGGPAALKRLVDACHARGIAVILDVVYNHFGPNDLSIWQFDGWFQRWLGQEMGGIYFYNDWRAWTKWGEKNRPDYGRDEVRQFIRDNAMRWLEEFRLDGLRFDMTVFIRNVYGHNGDPPDDPNNLAGWGWNLMRWVNDEVSRSQPWKITIAEDMQDNPWLTKHTSDGGAGFDSQWDAEFHHRMRDVLIVARDEDRDTGVVRVQIQRAFNGNPLERVIFTESHDEVAASNGKRRLTVDVTPDDPASWYAKKRTTLGAAVVFTSPGIPMLCQGQEILESIPFGDVNRLDWDKYDRFRGIYTLYRDLARLRRNWFNNTRGLRGPNLHFFHENATDKVVAYHRWENGGPGDDVVVVLNFANRGYSTYTIGLPRPGTWFVRFNSDWSGYSGDFGNWFSYDTTAEWGGRDGLPCHGNVGIGPYTAIILSQ
ncbi:MAG TPA: alpha-amylase family glycosyl hydrolase [Gemmataceae bacterium]|nr:alpha-amylase family glycosyl hydrolase [Gemmataceae bacterium]